jgi:hypothetical protein
MRLSEFSRIGVGWAVYLWVRVKVKVEVDMKVYMVANTISRL